ncbi:MAG TPA: hypothetical protein VII72_05540 [Myxococcota bacterium]|jgi:hypothetical protein
MRIDVSVFLTVGALLALQVLSPSAVRAQDGADGGQAGEDRWVPSFSITGGALIQNQDGFVDSFQFEDGGTTPVALQGVVDGNDLNVAPFVGMNLEVMSPAIPIPTRPRVFLGGEFLPTFATERRVALDKDPGCLKGPLPDAPCIQDIVGIPISPIPEDALVGEGSKTTAEFDLLVFGANLGVSFPARIGKRQLRIKPSFGWINYKVKATGLVSDGDCNPDTRCTPISPNPPTVQPGFLRETTLEGSDSLYFNGIGPGLDVEMDVGRYYGWLGVSLFLGGRAYRTLGDRTIEFGTSQAVVDQLGSDVAFANWEVEVDPWMYRAHVGIRFQWLGFPD